MNSLFYYLLYGSTLTLALMTCSSHTLALMTRSTQILALMTLLITLGLMTRST